MRNLLEETEEIMAAHGKTKDDIHWIGGNDFYISIVDFIKLANSDYDNGYGAQRVASDLKIVGDNWWLERAEYDGAEWWEFKTTPQAPSKYCVHPRGLYSLLGWEPLCECNNGY